MIWNIYYLMGKNMWTDEAKATAWGPDPVKGKKENIETSKEVHKVFGFKTDNKVALKDMPLGARMWQGAKYGGKIGLYMCLAMFVLTIVIVILGV